MTELEKLQVSLSLIQSRLAAMEKRCALGCLNSDHQCDAIAVHGVASRLMLPEPLFSLKGKDRDRLIAELRIRGWSKSRIARAVGIPEQAVYRSMKRATK